jgi:D-alanyl-D-alanine carboxypeptidase/D-alanyl-D-alanine-endopeptidase (penicillin-binding protein 4)
VKTATELGVTSTSFFPFDGAGSDDQGRTTPAALAVFLRNVETTPYGSALFNALPVLGRSGTLANVLPNSAAAGRAQVKTGNRVVSTPADQIIVLGNSLAGYVETKSGRRVTFMIAVGNVPISTPAEFEVVTADQARMVVAIQQDLLASRLCSACQIAPDCWILDITSGRSPPPAATPTTACSASRISLPGMACGFCD